MGWQVSCYLTVEGEAKGCDQAKVGDLIAAVGDKTLDFREGIITSLPDVVDKIGRFGGEARGHRGGNRIQPTHGEVAHRIASFPAEFL